jgi:hypothetical protein
VYAIGTQKLVVYRNIVRHQYFSQNSHSIAPCRDASNKVSPLSYFLLVPPLQPPSICSDRSLHAFRRAVSRAADARGRHGPNSLIPASPWCQATFAAKTNRSTAYSDRPGCFRRMCRDHRRRDIYAVPVFWVALGRNHIYAPFLMFYPKLLYMASDQTSNTHIHLCWNRNFMP